jgi:hypothetical protein
MWKRIDRNMDSKAESAPGGHRQELRRIAGTEPVCNEPTVSAASADRCILATIDMRGRLVGLRFSPGIEQLTYDEIAEQVLATVRQAAEQVSRLDR